MQRLKIAHLKRRQAGTSLVEILVVIVVFLTGILAIVQIFPGGFRLLGTTRNNEIASQLGRSEQERLKGMSEQLPEQIVAVSYLFNAGQVGILIDSTRSANDLSPASGATQ